MKDRDVVFRDAALARLSVPDELTEVLSITRPSDWLILGALGLLLTAGLIWAAAVNLEVSVPARGVLHDAQGILFVSDTRAGEIRRGLQVRLTSERGALAGVVSRVRPMSAREVRVDVAIVDAEARLSGEAAVQAYIILRRERAIDALLPWLHASRGHQ